MDDPSRESEEQNSKMHFSMSCSIVTKFFGCYSSVAAIGALFQTLELFHKKPSSEDNEEAESSEDKENETNNDDKNIGDEESSKEKRNETDKKVIRPDSIDLNYENVKGYDSIKGALEEYVQYFQNKNKFKQIGGEISIGIVILGDEGYGKTHLVQAFAGQTKTNLYQISMSDKDVGVFYCHGEKFEDIKELFAIAKDNSPSIIFIDDLDKQCNEDGRHNLHSFLLQMDKLTSEDGVIIIVTAKHKSDIPDELFKPKRFENTIQLHEPDYEERKQLLSYYFSKISIDELTIDSVDMDVLSRLLEYKSPKELKHIANRSAIKSSMENQTRVGMQIILDTIDIIEMGPRIDYGLLDKEDLKITAYHEIGHALLVHYSKDSKPLFKATILPHRHTLGNVLGHTSTIDRKELYYMRRGHLLTEMDISMGGRCAEEILLGKDQVTTGTNVILDSTLFQVYY